MQNIIVTLSHGPRSVENTDKALGIHEQPCLNSWDGFGGRDGQEVESERHGMVVAVWPETELLYVSSPSPVRR